MKIRSADKDDIRVVCAGFQLLAASTDIVKNSGVALPKIYDGLF